MDPCKPKGRELVRRWSDTHMPPKQENVTRSIERKDVALLEYLLKNAAVAVQSSGTMEEKLLLQRSLCRVGSDEQKEACCQTQNELENFDFTKLPPMILEALEKKAMEQMSELEQSITKLVSVLRPDFATCSSADGSKTSALDFVINYLRNGYDVKSAQQHVEQERELLLQFDALSQRPEESSSGSCRADISKYMTALSAESLSLRREAESTLAEAEASSMSLQKELKELDELKKTAADLKMQLADKQKKMRAYLILSQQPLYQQLYDEYKRLKEELELYMFVIENVPD